MSRPRVALLALSALAALTLRLAEPRDLLAILGPILLALATLVIAALLLATLRGLRDGTLLVAEPVPVPVPVVVQAPG